MADAKDLKRNQELPKNVRLNETDLEGLVGKKQKQKNNLELFRGRILIRKTLPPLGTYSVLIFFSCGIRRRRIWYRLDRLSGWRWVCDGRCAKDVRSCERCEIVATKRQVPTWSNSLLHYLFITYLKTCRTFLRKSFSPFQERASVGICLPIIPTTVSSIAHADDYHANDYHMHRSLSISLWDGLGH